MLEPVIRVLATAIARRIERGSLLFAAIGTIVGAALGFWIPWEMYRREWTEEHWRAPGIALSIALGLVGGITGSFVRRRQPELAPWQLTVDESTVVRITNLNEWLGALAAVLIVAGLGAWLCVDQWVKGKSVLRDAPYVLLFVPVLAVAAYMLAPSVMWVDYGREIIVRHTFRARAYPRDSVSRWGFETRRGTLVQEPPGVGCPFVVFFRDGRHVKTVVTPEKASRLVAVMLLGKSTSSRN
jgi:hypothetical protein